MALIETESPRSHIVVKTTVEAPYLHSKRKRLIDIIFGVVGLVCVAVVFLPVAILIKVNSRGPVFYRQSRLGVKGRQFLLIKFRTMIADAEISGKPVFAQAADPRVTGFGNFLRRSYLDEFPQWWNVLKGEMSVVGPRPERPEISDKIVERYPNFENRTKAKPGITGLAQTQFGYVRTFADSKRKLNYDQLYIEIASLKVDVWIMLRTIIRVIGRRGT